MQNNDSLSSNSAPSTLGGSPASVTFQGRPIPNAVPVLGDSFYLPGFVQTCLQKEPEQLYESLDRSAPWTNPEDENFRYRGKELPRQKAFWTRSPTAPLDVDAPPKKLWCYRYPGFQYGSMESYRPFERTPDILWIANQLQDHLVYQPTDSSAGKSLVFNHVIGTRYRGADDNIGYHSDKIQDITPNTPIVSVSLGETRELHLGRKETTPRVDADGSATLVTKMVFEQAFALQPGDAFLLGPKTNMLHQHAIVPVSGERAIQREPTSPVGPRISLVLRDIASSISLEDAREKARATVAARNSRRAAKQEPVSVKKRVQDDAEEETPKEPGASRRQKVQTEK